MNPENPLNLQREGVPGEWDVEDKLFEILTTYLPPVSDMTAGQAAEQINRLFPANRPEGSDKESPESFLFEFWDLMIKVACQLDHEEIPMQRFVNLLKALRQLPANVVLGDGTPAWRDLPHFSMYLSEEWNSFNPRESGPDDERLCRWINLNGLMIYLDNGELLDGLSRALVTISLCLESDEGKAQASVMSLVPAAAKWFKLCGSKIYKASQAGECRDSEVRGQLWKGDPGYCMPRWEFWRTRLAQLAEYPESEQITKEMCLTALSVMDQAAGH
ncbi:hypothetical protein BDV37DRAFT_284844 [Aspergillus pseudonomiae]|uniref:Uncharacterized protein n=1 Tax=Aspergillus pseudonomiae TaxID=1506151 RepID=A0A5N7D8R5_9EURO|nr:uncharacterized protein BDV37DRAFT_284844 [Aspergillus pseudonomiae]KAE8402363.1 hypothetical protein BDV37DRAFT_284844 [Aspergillus pseudonomiae]